MEEGAHRLIISVDNVTKIMLPNRVESVLNASAMNNNDRASSQKRIMISVTEEIE